MGLINKAAAELWLNKGHMCYKNAAFVTIK